MNCDNCQNLLSEFVNSESALSAEVEAHLEICEGCAGIYRDFSALSEFCSVYQEEEIAPPNSQALWCRISNIIESEDQPAVTAPAEAEKKKGFLAGVWQKSWQLSFSQAVTAVMGVAIISSLLTVVGIKSSFSPTNNSGANSNTQPSLFDTLLSKAGITPAPEALREKTFNEKQAVIDYWNSRVETRRGQWTARVRDTFDRNLREIDQVVFEYSQTLKENPQDSLTEEMLNSAMNEKMDLLREFSEL